MLEMDVGRARKNYGITNLQGRMLKACTWHEIVYGQGKVKKSRLPWDRVINMARTKARFAADKVADIESYIDGELVAITTLTYLGKEDFTRQLLFDVKVEIGD